jgi:hypothetical protein
MAFVLQHHITLYPAAVGLRSVRTGRPDRPQLLYSRRRSELRCGWRRHQEQSINQRDFLHQYQTHSEPLSNSLRVARLTNCRSILLSMTTNVLRRNCALACRSPMRIGHHWQRSLGSHHYRRQRHSLGSFGPWNTRGRRRSVLLRARNRSPRAECRSPHSKSRHRPTRRFDGRHSSGCKRCLVPRWQMSGPETDAIHFSWVCLARRILNTLRHEKRGHLIQHPRPPRSASRFTGATVFHRPYILCNAA